ncbi:exported hypothetical protein [Candidatus Sulfotelmatobacter sp. SbA7]|nr:exported hypothetical protein [Candidatus Sulfotelmatobacter sp. SbA7]
MVSPWLLLRTTGSPSAQAWECAYLPLYGTFDRLFCPRNLADNPGAPKSSMQKPKNKPRFQRQIYIPLKTLLPARAIFYVGSSKETSRVSERILRRLKT